MSRGRSRRRLFHFIENDTPRHAPDHENPEYYNLPRQVFPQAYIPNGNVDIVRVSTIEKGSLHGDQMLAFVTAKAPDIDTYSDLEYACSAINEERFAPQLEFLHEISQSI